jgi:hypothetical protein
MIGRATITPAELDVLIDAPSGTALGLCEEHGVRLFQLDAGAPKLIGWRSAARLIAVWLADRPAELAGRLHRLDQLRAGLEEAARAEVAAPEQLRAGGVEDIAAAIELVRQAAAAAQGSARWLRARQFDGWAVTNAPGVTAEQLRERFGPWTELLRAAGLTAPNTTKRRSVGDSKKQAALADVRRAAEETGESPLTSPTYDRWAKINGATTRGAVIRFFGRWPSVLAAASLPTKRAMWRGTPAEMLNALRSAADDLETSHLTVSAYLGWRESHDGPGFRQLETVFGCWREAVLQAGLESGRDRNQLPTFLPNDTDTGSV